MNPAFNAVTAASDAERRNPFPGTTTHLGTAVQSFEKDFWVCWAPGALFNGLPIGGPRRRFKGGTSMSRAFNLISRFSVDIDITVFRDGPEQATSVAELKALSGKKRRARLDATATFPIAILLCVARHWSACRTPWEYQKSLAYPSNKKEFDQDHSRCCCHGTSR